MQINKYLLVGGCDCQKKKLLKIIPLLPQKLNGYVSIMLRRFFLG